MIESPYSIASSASSSQNSCSHELSPPTFQVSTPQFTRKLFTDVAFWVISLGFGMGVIFPFLILLLDIIPKSALAPSLFLSTIAAGLTAGGLTFWVVRQVIKPRLAELSERMRWVGESIRAATYSGDWSECRPESCHIPVDSDDEIGQCASAFNRLVDALVHAHNVDTAVSDFSKTLSSQLELDLLAKQTLELLLHHTSAFAGAVLVEQSGELEIIASFGLENVGMIKKSDHIVKAMETGKVVRINLPEDIRVEALLASFKPNSAVVLPVLFKEKVLGVILLAAHSPFSTEMDWLLDLFRQGLGLAFNNALAHKSIQRAAMLDALTDVYNRRFGIKQLDEILKRAHDESDILGLLMIDIDYFKRINDTFGHLVGDRVLKQVATLTRHTLREEDIIVRYGGEEFMIILPKANLETSRVISERLRRLIAETIFMEGDQRLEVTVSIGVTSFPEHPIIHEQEMIHNADTALYAAKENGRNQVVIAKPSGHYTNPDRSTSH